MSTSTADSTDIFRQLDEYPWDQDTQFQSGLSAILGDATSPVQIHELTLHAQCFYLSRKLSVPIDFGAYKSYLSSKPTTQDSQPEATRETSHATRQAEAGPKLEQSQDAPPPTFTAEPIADPQPLADITPASEKGAAPYPPTFAEIVELITSGKPIPGIKDIAPTLLTEQASKPSASKRRKPWEKDVPEEAVQGAGAALPGGEGGEKTVEGTFGDQRDRVVVQELPE